MFSLSSIVTEKAWMIACVVLFFACVGAGIKMGIMSHEITKLKQANADAQTEIANLSNRLGTEIRLKELAMQDSAGKESAIAGLKKQIADSDRAHGSAMKACEDRYRLCMSRSQCVDDTSDPKNPKRINYEDSKKIIDHLRGTSGK